LVEIDINEKEFFPVPYLEVESASESELEETVSLLGYTMADANSRTMYEIMRDMGLVKGDDFGF
jgi:adenylate cyclase class 2